MATTSTLPGDTSTTTASSDTTTSTSSATSTSQPGLPGEPTDLGPPPGTLLAVVGVAHDDVLNLRAAPGPSQEIVARIPPLFTDLESKGETRTLPEFWTVVDHEGTLGWIHLSFVGVLGETTDATSRFGVLEAESMEDLGEAVAVAAAPSDGEFPTRIEMVVAPTHGDLGEVTFDVIGLGDDSVLGVRLHVFGEPSADGFRLTTVEQTAICDPTRGADSSGACV